jgi:23S rRNA (cytosine1962-C5)-methyltransferase
VFSGAIKSNTYHLAEGQVVEIRSADDEFLALAHFQVGSIMLRILSFEQRVIDAGFWHERIEAAWQYRQMLGFTGEGETDVFRLIHGEGDELPGLVIDYYHQTVVIQAHSVGMHHEREAIVEALKDVLGANLAAVYYKSEATLPFKAELNAQNQYLWGEGLATVVHENSLQFGVDWENGQKTGFFIDQRLNRQLVAQYARNRRVLNLFGYTGGFSVYALEGGADWVDTVDVSERAVEQSRRNVELNFGPDAPHEAIVADAFEFLRDIANRYDLIVLDPPAFAKHQNVLDKALQAYKRLNQRAIEQIRPGGILFTFSCSQVVSKLDFRKSVFAAAANSHRRVRILHQLSQPPDHPVNIYHPESEYLKGLVLYVE